MPLAPEVGLRWALAGGKPQALAILDRLAGEGWLPSRLYAAAGLPPADQAALRDWAARHGLTADDTPPDAGELAGLDILLSCRYGLLAPALFAAPRLGAVNVHSSLLPAYRGIHPVSWALVDGRDRTGVTLHRIDAGADTGDVLLQRALDIAEDDDLWSLTARLDALSAELVVELFQFLERHGGLPPAIPQQGEVSWARRRRPEDGRVDWRQPARAIHNLRRALPSPLPPARTTRADGTPLSLLDSRPPRPDAVTVAPPGTVVSVLGAGWCEVAAGDGRRLELRLEPTPREGECLG